MDRRAFLKTAAATGAVVVSAEAAPRLALFGLNPRLRRAAYGGATIEVLTGEPIGFIAPELHGHFVEHLGGVVYDGIWVGEGSKIPNIGGIRKSLADALRAIGPPIIRWPGGCFADSYNWRDGIGPRSGRPRRTNFWIDSSDWPKGCPDGPWKYDTNEFGTNEFIRFCQLVGGQPYLAVNLRSLSARDFDDWVDYCNAPAGATTMADARAASGAQPPFGVRYWGVGNESWGCGGNFKPEEYAAEYRRFVEWVPRHGVALSFIASGPNGGDIDWTRRFFAAMAERRALGRIGGWALHHYSWNVTGGRTTSWREGKGDAVAYPVDEWYELLQEASRVEALITDHWTAMGEADTPHRIKLVVDEWGAWYRPGTEVDPTHLFGQQSTMRDAVLAGLSLDAFNRHADKVAMANVAQLVNCLHSLFLAHEDRLVTTPTYHVFALYRAHQGGRAVRTVFSAPSVSYTRNGKPATLPSLSGSASLHDRSLVLTVTNADAREAHEAAISVPGRGMAAVSVTELVSDDIHAVNSFEAPARIAPTGERRADVRGTQLVHTFAPASVTRLRIELT
jgi:alpha-N-arabinofuranosidase